MLWSNPFLAATAGPAATLLASDIYNQATAVDGTIQLGCLSTMQIVLECCGDCSYLKSHTKTKHAAAGGRQDGAALTSVG